MVQGLDILAEGLRLRHLQLPGGGDGGSWTFSGLLSKNECGYIVNSRVSLL